MNSTFRWADTNGDENYNRITFKYSNYNYFMKHLLFVLFLFNISFVYGQYSMGCLPENFNNQMVVKKDYPVQRGSDMPYYFSLAQYAPPVGHQGQLGSCTSWATAYAGLTIVKRIESSNNYISPFSPVDLHNRVKSKNEDNPCLGGAAISSALQMLKYYGADNSSFNSDFCSFQVPYYSYDNKLHDYEYITVSSYNLKSALYYDKSPIIICMKSYNNGWDKNYNIVNGVWNSYYDYPNGSYHAMCVVGYDDNKSGGAFLVMNSWGSSWGQNGYFWLKYSDLSSVTDAYSMKPEIASVVVINKETYTSYKAQYFRLYNECSEKAYLSCAKRVNGYWKAQGWYAVNPNSSVDYYIGDRDAGEIFWMATTSGQTLRWYDGNSNGKYLCYDPINAFEYDEYDNCSNKIYYYRYNPESYGFSTVSQTITCPGYSRFRGDSTIKQDGSFINKQLDSRRADTANIYWKKEFILFDLLTGKMILPQENAAKETYDIWYIDDKKQIQNKLFDVKSLVNLKKPKFNSRSNAEKWLELNK